MKKTIVLLFAAFNISIISAQNIFRATIKDAETKKSLPGAVVLVKVSLNTAIADSSGNVVLRNIPDGKQVLVFRHEGHAERRDTFNFPLSETSLQIILMEGIEEELEEVIVSSTRTSRTINNTPTRVETIELEEIDEKSNMRPANVSMMLHESTGIQVQQTSATSANASIRIQGLDGRYTQLLKDGYPNFGNFASGLSILEIPPLDLKQVEVIKGPASTLYGGGAIAGVVNFVSKTPKEQAEYNMVLNQSNIGQSNIGVFASKRNKKIGYTMLALVNLQKPYDVDKDDFTELPKSTDFTIHPKLFIYPGQKSKLTIGNAFTMGNRLGGDMHVIRKEADSNHTYFEENKTQRNITTAEFEQNYKDNNHLNIRGSFSYYNRVINLSDFSFSGRNLNSYADISYLHHFKKQTWIWGANYIIDKFKQTDTSMFPKKDFNTQTAGIYAQQTWDISESIKLESGLRADRVSYSNQNYKNSQVFLLPRVSALFKIDNKWGSRIGGGMGYKAPNIFTERTESFQYRNLLPLNNVTAERSMGSTADLNFKSKFSKDFFFVANQMFFYTIIRNATILKTNSFGQSFFNNANKPVISKGFETNLKLIYKNDLKLFVGYTFTYARAKYLSGNQFLPQLPRSKMNLALVYEKEKKFKIGLEAYYSDRQYLYNGVITNPFWEFGAMAEKTIGKIAIYINFENFTDVRQSRYKRVVNEPHNNPTFDDIWTHTEGFVFNGGIKIKL